MSKELEIIAAGMAATSPTSTERFENMSHWNQQRWLSRAAHVVSVLAASGHTIVQVPEPLPLGHKFRGMGHSCTKGLPGRRLCGESETAHLPADTAAEEDTNA